MSEGLDGLDEQPPRGPRQQPGQSSMPPQPPEDAAEDRPAMMPPPNVPPEELMGLTTEMEPIGEAVQKRRRVDHTLARFSAVHDELAAEEKARKAKKLKLNPFAGDVDELDDHLTGLGQVPGAEPGEVVDFVDSKSGPEAPTEEARTVRTPPLRVAEPGADLPTEVVPAVDEPVRDDSPAEPEPEPESEPDPEPEVVVTEVPPRQPHDRKVLAGRFAAIAVAAVVFVATGIGWGYAKWTDGSIDDVRALDPNSDAITNAAAQQGDENFLLVGSDSREGAAAEEGVGDAEQVPGARSDTVMVAHVPADRSRVVLVSFPRDLEINRPSCERFDAKTNTYTGEQVPGQKIAKMNTAYQVGGPLCMTKVVQELSGLNITRFIGINFDGFKGMVDAVDGVNVCVEKPMFDTVLNTWVVKDAGTEVLLRGDQALNFVRARHVVGDITSDYGRIKRQQRFLSALLRKAMSSQVLLDPGKLTSFTSEFAKSTFGDNIGLDSLLRLGQSLQGLEAGRVTFITVPTVGTSNTRGNETLLPDDNKALFHAIITKQALPGEKPAGGQQAMPQPAPLRQQQTEQVDPKTLKIQVLNGGNTTDRIARKTADKLTGVGYTVVQVNSGPSVPKTTIRYGKGREAQAQTLASSIPGATLELDPGAGTALVLVLGPEFDGTVTAPGGAGGPAQEELPANLSTINAGDVSCA
ncbi:LCP family protein [Actinokineospora sp. PR83]|nr:LCP family protein [Actinokineospora sp. PR83]